MSVTLEQVKEYLRIDGNEEDELVAALMKVADAYLVSAIGGYRLIYETDTEFAAKADLLLCILTAEYYQNRANEQRGGDFTFAIRSLLTQLQYWTKMLDVLEESEEMTPISDDDIEGLMK